MDPNQKKRIDLINSIMRNPNLSRTIHEAAAAPIGSTKRDKAKSIISIINKINPSGGSLNGQGGPGYNGQGGWGDVGNFIGSMGSGIAGAARDIFAPSAGTPIAGTPGAPTPSSAGDIGNAIGSIPGRIGDTVGAIQDWNYNAANNVDKAASDFAAGVGRGFNNQPESVHVFAAAPEIKSATDTTQLASRLSSNMTPEGDALVPNMTPSGPQNQPDPHSNVSTETPVVADDQNTANISGAVAGDETSTPSSISTVIKPDTSHSNNSGSDLSGPKTGAAHDIALKIPGLTNITLPASQVIQEFGLRNVWDAFKQNEGSSPKGVEHNPGNIKFAGLPGQIDSGIHPADDPKGTFASYSTDQEGDQAGMDLLMRAASGKISAYGQNPTFEQLANTYTNTGPGSTGNGGSSNNGSQPGAPGAVTEIDAANALQQAVADNMGPEAFATMWAGKISSSQLSDMTAVLQAKKDLDAISARRTELMQMNPDIVPYLEGYEKKNDTLISKVDSLIASTLTALQTQHLDATSVEQYTNSLTFLQNVKAGQMQNNAGFINNSIDKYNSDLSNIDQMYNQATTSYDNAVKSGQALDKTTYDRVHADLVDMYNQATPEKLYARNEAMSKLGSLNSSIVNGLSGMDTTDKIAQQNSYADKIIDTVKSTTDGSVSGKLLSGSNAPNLPALMKSLVLDQSKPDDPRWILDLFTSGAHKALVSEIGVIDPTTGAITTPANPGILGKTLQYEADMENAIAILPPATQAWMAPYLADSRKTLIKDVQIGMQNYIQGNPDPVKNAIYELSGKKTPGLFSFLSGTPTPPSTVGQWIKNNPNVDPEVLTALWQAVQRNKEGGDTNFNLVDSFTAATSPNQVIDPNNPIPAMINGTPINSPSLDATSKLAGYLSNQIATPYIDLVNQNAGFTGYSPYPLPTLNLGQAESNPTINASAFEGYMGYVGDSSKLGGTNPDDGDIKGTNPKGEPIYVRDAIKEDTAKKQLLNADPYWAQHGYSMGTTQLDHIIPLEAGGTMSMNNMMLIPTQSDQNNQTFEDNIGKLYAAGAISRADAAQASIDYKINKKITPTIQKIMSGTY